MVNESNKNDDVCSLRYFTFSIHSFLVLTMA